MDQQKILIAAHRGTAGGNIPFNVTPAFECALAQRADILELDVSKSRDGVLYVFHPKLEPVFLGIDTLLSDMDSPEIDKLRYLNFDRAVTQYPIERLEEVLKTFRGRCRINVDKFWVAPLEIAALIRELGMQDQVLVKSRFSPEALRDAQEYALDLPYMPVYYDVPYLPKYCDVIDPEEAFRDFRGRWEGVELCFSSEDSPLAQRSFVEKAHRQGKKLWINSIVYNYKKVLSAGHNDDVAVAGDPDKGWGWLAQQGYDIIQTDFPLMLHEYLTQKGLR